MNEIRYPRIHYTWNEFDEDIGKLANNAIRNEKLFKCKYTHIYGIPRGGLVVAVALSHRLERKFIENKKDIEKINNYVEKVLVVDEICDSGNTLIGFLKSIKKGEEMATLVIHYREGSFYEPTFRRIEIKTQQFVVYPWEGAFDEPRRPIRN